MHLSSMFGFANAAWFDQFVLWSVASMAGVLVSVVSALDLILDSESEADPG